MARVEVVTTALNEPPPWDIARRAAMDFSKLPDDCPICGGTTKRLSPEVVVCEACDHFFEV